MRVAARPASAAPCSGSSSGKGPTQRSAASITILDPLDWVRAQGIVLQSARGPVPNLAEHVAGKPIRGPHGDRRPPDGRGAVPRLGPCRRPRRRRAGHAQHAVGHRPQPGRRDRLAAAVADAVAPLVELGQRSLGARQPGLERAADADVGQAADRLGRAVADALAEPLRLAELGPFRERRDPLERALAARHELAADRGEVEVVRHAAPRPSARVANGPRSPTPPADRRSPGAPR